MTPNKNCPPLVREAVRFARSVNFDLSCLPAQGRLLQALVHGRPGAVIGETGTGCGVGLAWVVSAADSSTSVVSIERDEDLAKGTAAAGYTNVTVVNSDWKSLGLWPVRPLGPRRRRCR